MRTESIFKVGDTDFSNHVIAGTYAVNNMPVYKEYDDANGSKHKFKIRDKVVGSFNMFFRTAEEFNNFVSAIQENTSTTNYTVATWLLVNNTNEEKQTNLFIDFAPTRNRDDKWQDYFEVFTVTVEER